jgi:hypothetical protein
MLVIPRPSGLAARALFSELVKYAEEKDSKLKSSSEPELSSPLEE